MFDGIAVENAAEKPQLGNVGLPFADGSYSRDVSTADLGIAAGTTSLPALNALLTVTESLEVNPVVHVPVV